MKSPTPSRIVERLAQAGKLLVTLAVAYVFIYILVVVTGVHARFQASRELRQNLPAVYVGNNFPETGPSERVEALWPQFPRTAPSTLRRTLLNGVEVLSEDWESTADATEILSYYRQQMAARGWRDVTEETYGLQPHLRESGIEDTGLQDEKYLEVYRKVMDSSLVLSRGQWSMHVMTNPGKRPMGATAVRIYCAETPSIKEFFTSMAPVNAGLGKPQTATKVVDAVQVSGKERYQTSIRVKPLEPKQAFEQELASLRQNGWQPFMMAPPEQSRGGLALWLTKGTQYAVLVVEAARDGAGSTVTLMEVTSTDLKR